MSIYSYTGEVVEVIVASPDDYRIIAFGAQGGSSIARAGGKGAEISGVFHLTTGEILEIVVGGAGSGSRTNAGGGGSFVRETSRRPDQTLVFAGGGAGAGLAPAAYGHGGVTTNYGRPIGGAGGGLFGGGGGG